MQFQDEFFQGGKIARCSFEEEQHFFGGVDFSFPPIVRFEGRDKIGAGDEFFLKSGAREFSRDLYVWRGDKDDSGLSRRFHRELNSAGILGRVGILGRLAGLETCDTADLGICATMLKPAMSVNFSGGLFFDLHISI